MEKKEKNSLGAKLKALRLELGYSQRQLAKLSDLSHPTISLIEADKIDPSLGTLKKLLTACGQKVSDFFVEYEEMTSIKRKDEIASVSSRGVTLRYITPRNKDSALAVTQEIYTPGADTGDMPLTHHGQEAGIVIRGRFELTLGDRIYILEAGDAYCYPSTTPHRLRNLSEFEGEIINAASPPSF